MRSAYVVVFALFAGLIVWGSIGLVSLAVQQAREDGIATRLNSKRWEGAKVARVCANGSKIWRLKTGEHVTAVGQPIDDINVVCG